MLKRPSIEPGMVTFPNRSEMIATIIDAGMLMKSHGSVYSMSLNYNETNHTGNFPEESWKTCWSNTANLRTAEEKKPRGFCPLEKSTPETHHAGGRLHGVKVSPAGYRKCSPWEPNSRVKNFDIHAEECILCSASWVQDRPIRVSQRSISVKYLDAQQPWSPSMGPKDWARSLGNSSPWRNFLQEPSRSHPGIRPMTIRFLYPSHINTQYPRFSNEGLTGIWKGIKKTASWEFANIAEDPSL